MWYQPFEKISQLKVILGRNAGIGDAEDFEIYEEEIDSASNFADASSSRGVVCLQEFR